MTEVIGALSEDDKRIWKELWDTVHNDHYACFYQEMIAEFLVARWRLLDTLTRFLTTLTASGSAVAAWSFWANSNSGVTTWAIISGIAAVISLIHSSAGISDRIKEDTMVFATFMGLRLDLEAFKKKMRLGYYESLTAFRNEYMEINAKFGKAHSLKHPDFILTKKREILIQEDLDKRMGY